MRNSRHIRILSIVLVSVVSLCSLLTLRAQCQSQPPLTTAEVSPPKTATISLVGDILLGAKVGQVGATRGTAWLFTDVKDIFLQDDLTIGNFESAVTRGGTPAKKQYVFRADPSVLPVLRANGVEAVSLANNHSLDYGQAALLETLGQMQQAGIATAGAGKDVESAGTAVYFHTVQGTVALIAASRVLPYASWKAGVHHPGIADAYNPTRLYAEIRRARQRADFVIVYLHWGIERATTPAPYQRAMARGCIDAGADAVIGTHPHVLQGFEYYQGKLIAYSLGNFIFTNHGKNTVILQLEIAGKKLVAARVIPCRILHYRPMLVTTPADRRVIFDGLQSRSYGIRIADDGTLAQE